MRITIKYDSCWRNSFLDGNNHEPLPKNGRSFIGSMTALKTAGNFKIADITLSTVMGLLNRLIGDQRKLYQARSAANYFFREEEQQALIKFNDVPEKSILTNEMTFIRNMKGSKDQNSFTGILQSEDPMFSADYGALFWGILELNLESLCQFIIDGKSTAECPILEPLYICKQFELLAKLKPVPNEGLISEAVKTLKNHFSSVSYENNKELIVPSMLYCSALYLQLERLSTRFDMQSATTKSGGISGISKRIFTKKDFMNRFTTGKGKIIWGNPYIKKERIKGQGEVTSVLTKASGELEITLDVDKHRGNEIADMIENAGVSSFYLGKKGLAYVTKIRV